MEQGDAGGLRTGPRVEVREARVGRVLTPASGFIGAYKYTLNPYNGCAFACDYCYARFFAPNVELEARWGEWVRVKANAVALLERAIAAGELVAGDAVYLSSVTDPYQPLEAKLRLTRSLLKRLVMVQPRLTVQTRSPIVARDVDLLGRLERVRVNISIPTDDEAMRLRYEPHAPAIKVRLKTAERLRAAGIPIGVSVTPMLPLRDGRAFGARLRELGAAEYVAAGFHRPRARFTAGTNAHTLAKLREDGWTRSRYLEARAALAEGLGETILLEARAGFRLAE